MEHLFVSNESEAEQPSTLQLMADSINDAIKAGLVESVKRRVTLDLVPDAVLQSKITSAEITWYMGQLYAPAQQNAVNKNALIETLFELLMIQRTILHKDGNYIVSGEEVKSGSRIIGILLTAHHSKVKRVADVEPEVQ